MSGSLWTFVAVRGDAARGGLCEWLGLQNETVEVVQDDFRNRGGAVDVKIFGTLQELLAETSSTWYGCFFLATLRLAYRTHPKPYLPLQEFL